MEIIPRPNLSPTIKRNLSALLSMVFLVGIGEHLGRRFLPIYLLALQGGILSIGIIGGLDNLLGALYSFPGGYLSERLGHKRSLLAFDLMAAVGYVVVIFVQTWWVALLGMVCFLTWSSVSLPATMSLLFSNMPGNRHVLGVSLHSFMRRVPMALGPLLGGLLIDLYGLRLGVRLSFSVALALAGISMVLQQGLMEDVPIRERVEMRPWVVWRWMKPDLRRLLLSDILVRFCEQIPYAFVVIWCMVEWKVSAVDFGWLTVIENATAMAIYIPVASLADRSGRKPFVVATFLIFTAFPLVLLFTRGFWGMSLAFVIRGLKEFGEPARKALIMELSDPDKEAATFGLYYLLRDTIVALAAFGGAFLWMYSPAANFITAACCGLVGALYFAVFGRNIAPRKFKTA